MVKSEHFVYPQAHLVNILTTTRDHHPNFVLMLGAGASANSNVKVVKQMLTEWRNCHYKLYKQSDQSLEEHLKSQIWYNQHNEYSILFEKLYDLPSQRREYIESCIKDALPSIGYVYLVNLLEKGVFNTVFTTNFDDLLNEACYQFSSNVRPIVCAHDSSINSIRITSHRPKIIKLHGDFLFDNIKNTLRELETLEKNTVDKFKQYAAEFGIIVLGYAGNDRSVMDTFNTLLKFDDFFPNGIYWCIRKNSQPSTEALQLARYPKFKFIEINDFDEFFAILNKELNLPLQLEMSDPYKALSNKLNGLVNMMDKTKVNSRNDFIQENINFLASEILRYSEYQTTTKNSVSTDPQKLPDLQKFPIPFNLISKIKEKNQEYLEAYHFARLELAERPTLSVLLSVVQNMYKSGSLEDEEMIIKKIESLKSLFIERPNSTFDFAIVFIKNKRWEAANSILELGYELGYGNSSFSYNFYLLNKLQIKKHQNIQFDTSEKSDLEKIAESSDAADVLGAYILLERTDKIEEQLVKVLNDGYILGELKSWPIIDLINIKFKNEEFNKELKNQTS